MAIMLKTVCSYYAAWHCVVVYDIILPLATDRISWQQMLRIQVFSWAWRYCFGDTRNICNLFVQFHKRIEHTKVIHCLILWQSTHTIVLQDAGSELFCIAIKSYRRIDTFRMLHSGVSNVVFLALTRYTSIVRLSLKRLNLMLLSICLKVDQPRYNH